MLYGALNAAAYSCLLPLWEGFDEGFHYGYVQLLSHDLAFPILGKAFLSREIWRSYELTPVSHYLQPYTHAPLSFSDYFVLPERQRQDSRYRLFAIPFDWKRQPQSDKPNYEVNQSPLYYVVAAVPDLLLGGVALPARVLCLRLLFSVLAVGLIAHSTLLMGRELGLADLWIHGALFCVFSSQMLLAVICHICNDCLAIPTAAYLIWTTMRAARAADNRVWAGVGIALSAALLVKAYFLFLVPVPVLLLAWRFGRGRIRWRQVLAFAAPVILFAVPWYARNVALYRSVSATVESTSGLTPAVFAAAALKLPWGESIRYMAHSGLWTGNNSFTTFSAVTLDVLLLVLGSGVLIGLVRTGRTAQEVVLAAYVLAFSFGLAFVSVAFFISTTGGAISAVPWYEQILLVPVVLMAVLGCRRSARVGKFVFLGLVTLWTYLMVCTYWVKLVPLYGGMAAGRAGVPQLWAWYWNNSSQRNSILRSMLLVPPETVWVLGGLASVLGVALCALLLTKAFRISSIE